MGDHRLSVCCPAGDSFERVAAILSLFRDVADEIVCCTNSAPAERVYGALGDVADRIVHYEWQPGLSLDQVLPWVYRQCSGDWLFVVHNDEVPSRALLEALPQMARDDLLGHVTTRRWLYRDEEHWLNEYPWEPDFQLRMLRNDPASLQFQRRTIHGGSLPTVPYQRHVNLPLYHLDNLVNSIDYRSAKIASLDAFAPTVPLFDGRSISEIYYQPERYSIREPEPVDAEDVAAIRHVLAATAADGGAVDSQGAVWGRRARLTTAPVEEILRHWPMRAPGESFYRGDVRVTGSSLSAERDMECFRAGEQRLLVVEITNLGAETWDCDLRGAEIYLASRWSGASRSSDEAEAAAPAIEGDRVPLTSYVHPGGRDLLLLPVQAPERPGRYLLDIDLLHEHVRWFGCGPRIDVLVRGLD